MKELAPAAVPAGVVTEMGPLLAPVGTPVTILVAVSEMMAAGTPLKATRVAPERFRPVMVTGSPGGPEVGVKPVIAGVTAVVIRPIEL